MVDITSILSLQGRARRNARSSLRRVRSQRAAALEATALLGGAAVVQPGLGGRPSNAPSGGARVYGADGG